MRAVELRGKLTDLRCGGFAVLLAQCRSSTLLCLFIIVVACVGLVTSELRDLTIIRAWLCLDADIASSSARSCGGLMSIGLHIQGLRHV